MKLQTRDRSFSAKLGLVVDSCSSALEFDQYICLREFHELLAASSDFKNAGYAVPNWVSVEQMLNADAWESAALAYLPDPAGFILSRGQANQAIASVVLPGQDAESTAFGATIALALVAAIASALQKKFS